MTPSNDDATTPLVPPPEPSSPPLLSRPRLAMRGLSTNRIMSIVSLASILGLALYFQYEVQQLGAELTQEEAQIKNLNTVIDEQAKIIRRFNTSVTNSDVLKKLQALEDSLNDTEKELTHELEKTEHSVEDRLKKTLDELGQTVKDAKTEIESEVVEVKKDVEKYVRTTQDQFSMENNFMVYQLAGTFTLLSGLISMWHMTAHLRKFNQPVVQRKILAILWMCPIYAITSWLSLVWPALEGYLAIVKDFYEAYIIYQFLSFCIAVLGRGDRDVVVDLLARRADHLTPPFRLCGCCRPDPYENDRALADAVLLQCQQFAMQFVFLRPLTSIAMFVLSELNCYGGGTSAMDYRSPQFYIIMVQNFSVFVAFAGLLKFYHAVDEDLAWCRPFAKFMCIKGVVFMTFWQGLAISILASTTDVGGDDEEKWAKSSQSFLICLEMLGFSIAHFYCFPTEEWEPGYKAAHSQSKFGDTIALGDFVSDLKLILTAKPKKKKKKPENDQETIPEEGDEDYEEETQACTSMASDADEESGLLEIDPDEVRAATARLVHRLEDDDQWESIEKQDGDGGNEDDLNDLQLSEVDEQEGDTSAPIGQYMGGPTGSADSGEGGNEQSTVEPNERTSLLGGSQGSDEMRSPNDEMLRPSIFTTVASMHSGSDLNSS